MVHDVTCKSLIHIAFSKSVHTIHQTGANVDKSPVDNYVDK